MPHIRINRLVEYHYQKDGIGIHGFGRLVSKEVVNPKLIKYVIKDGFGKSHTVFNKERGI